MGKETVNTAVNPSWPVFGTTLTFKNHQSLSSGYWQPAEINDHRAANSI